MDMKRWLKLIKRFFQGLWIMMGLIAKDIYYGSKRTLYKLFFKYVYPRIFKYIRFFWWLRKWYVYKPWGRFQKTVYYSILSRFYNKIYVFIYKFIKKPLCYLVNFVKGIPNWFHWRFLKFFFWIVNKSKFRREKILIYNKKLLRKYKIYSFWYFKLKLFPIKIYKNFIYLCLHPIKRCLKFIKWLLKLFIKTITLLLIVFFIFLCFVVIIIIIIINFF